MSGSLLLPESIAGDEDVRWKSDPEATNSGSSEMLPEMPVWLEHAPPYAGPPGL
jgi:hypothetical protein